MLINRTTIYGIVTVKAAIPAGRTHNEQAPVGDGRSRVISLNCNKPLSK
ncbi:MAG: hypothetical protein V4577_08860 [Bacteroidota bacterium]